MSLFVAGDFALLPSTKQYDFVPA